MSPSFLPRFIPNPAAAAELDALFLEARRGFGEIIKENAEQIAPEGRTGDYHHSIEVDDEGSVGTTDPFGHLVEWGSVNNPPYATIRTAVKTSGARLVEDDAP